MSAPTKVCEYEPITSHIANHVLSVLSDVGYTGGSFIDALVRAIKEANSVNRNRLASLPWYKGYVCAVALMDQDQPSGEAVLKLIAMGQPGAYYATPDPVVDEELGVRLCSYVHQYLPYGYCDEPAVDGSRYCEWHNGPDRGALDDEARDRAVDQAMGI